MKKGVLLVLFIIIVYIQFVSAEVIFQEDFEDGLGDWQTTNKDVDGWWELDWVLVSDVGTVDLHPPYIIWPVYVKRECDGEFSDCGGDSRNDYAYLFRTSDYGPPTLFKEFSTKGYEDVEVSFWLQTKIINLAVFGDVNNLEDDDYIRVEYRLGGTGGWNLIKRFKDVSIYFTKYSYPIPVIDNKDSVEIRFTFSDPDDTSAGYPGDHFFIDDFQLLGDRIIECEYNRDCSDGLYCNGNEVCRDGFCQPGIPIPLDDGIFCTTDTCDESQNIIVHTPIDTLCHSDTDCGDFYCDVLDGCLVEYEPDTKVCRPAKGVCDIDDYCSGYSERCPKDVKSTDECRAATGDCDEEEYCDGINSECPSDETKPTGTDCGVCAECDEGGDCIYDQTQDADCEDTICEDSCNNDLELFTWDWADDVPNECVGINECSANQCEYSSECSIDNCNAICEEETDCNNSTCSVEFQDYCSGTMLVEYDFDLTLDVTIVNDSCSNTCELDCTCTDCTPNCDVKPLASCVPGECGADCYQDTDCPEKCTALSHKLYNLTECVDCECYYSNYECVVGKCGAECDENTDCSCQADYCDGTTLIDYPDYGGCGTAGAQGCLCLVDEGSGGDCEPTIRQDHESCGCIDDDDIDGICNDVDVCPNSKPNELINNQGCDPFQFCGQWDCGMNCYYADFVPIDGTSERSLYPGDCTVVVLNRGGEHYPSCVPMTCTN